MDFSALLISHIIGAVLTGAATLTVCVSVIAGYSTAYRSLSLLMGALTAFDVLTGTMLAVMSPMITVASVCDNIALYVAVVVCVQYVLYTRLKNTPRELQLVSALSPVGAALLLTAGALALGF